MIIMRYGIFTVAEEFFQTLTTIPHVDVLRYRLLPAPDNLFEVEAQSTVTIDLTQPEATIFKDFGKNNQYEIRRAEAKDSINCRLFNSEEISAPFMAELDLHYRDLIRIKHVTPLNMQRMRLLQEQGNLFISKAEASDGTPLAWHVYMVAHKRARLLHSISLFRNTEQPAQRRLVGRANRLLHWNDITEFKKFGIDLYDFGGYYMGETDESKLRINQFKDEFHGQLRTEYNGFRFLGSKGFIAKVGFQSLNKLNQIRSTNK